MTSGRDVRTNSIVEVARQLYLCSARGKREGVRGRDALTAPKPGGLSGARGRGASGRGRARMGLERKMPILGPLGAPHRAHARPPCPGYRGIAWKRDRDRSMCSRATCRKVTPDTHCPPGARLATIPRLDHDWGLRRPTGEPLGKGIGSSGGFNLQTDRAAPDTPGSVSGACQSPPPTSKTTTDRAPKERPMAAAGGEARFRMFSSSTGGGRMRQKPAHPGTRGKAETMERFARHVSSGKAAFFRAAGIEFVLGRREGSAVGAQRQCKCAAHRTSSQSPFGRCGAGGLLGRDDVRPAQARTGRPAPTFSSR